MSGRLGAAFATKSNSRPITSTEPIPFGKHKGIPIDQVPRDYLGWALRNMDCCNPDHERYWPEFRTTLESVVGTEPDFTRPIPLSFPALCAKLAARGIKVRIEDGDLVTDGPSLTEQEQEGLRIHKSPLMAIVQLIERPAPGAGTIKRIWSADLRTRIKLWYGRMSKESHPDQGGTHEAQIAVNRCYRALMDVITEWEATR